MRDCFENSFSQCRAPEAPWSAAPRRRFYHHNLRKRRHTAALQSAARNIKLFRASFWLLASVAWAGALHAETRTIDPATSVISIRVFRSGLLSFLAHDHLVQARGLEGTAESQGNLGVAFKLSARLLKVIDPEASDKERAEIQQTMEEKVLEVDRYPEIRFQSTSVVVQGTGRWQVKGKLTLHGRTLPIEFVVQESKGRYRGKTTLRQTSFGIEPIRIAAGTVRVKDEIAIEFDAGLAPSK